MNIAEIATNRRTAKAFDPDRKIPQAIFEQLRVLLRFSPSSVNSQPWHFMVAADAAGKDRIARAAPAPYAYNGPKIRNASHVVVLCARTTCDDAHLEAVLAQEILDGRFPAPDAAASQRKSRLFYVDLHRHVRQDIRPWMEKQVYLALGTLLLGAAVLGIEACPMEGFDTGMLDAELGLNAKGLSAVAIVTLGYRSSDDWNARLPKSRLPDERIFTAI
ncbi:MAG TPA: oxygen-insensitive NAD(P)H nitroreductase [Kiritimatiellia bacterium]|jgi:nitroreductase/dihydropteridine reductase|nr:oxygen-insensitive NAD(P)H nitroreductase [Kiritimatiellia bacterium]